MLQSLNELCALCRSQVQRFRRGEPYDDRFCLEIFRRAVVDRNGDCWHELQNLYNDQVVAWCRRANSSANYKPEDLAAIAWEKFWLSFGPNQFSQANGTPAIQRYLKACVYSAMIDIAREQRPSVSIHRPLSDSPDEALTLADTFEDPSPTPEESVVDEASRQLLKQVVASHTQDEKERAVLYLKYELGLSSAEVHTRRPDLFPTIGEVYRVTRNLLDRLRRSPEMRRWLAEGN